MLGELLAGQFKTFRDSTATTHGYATQTAPTATSAICTLAVPNTGTYQVTAYFSYGATGDVAGNVRIQKNAGVISNIPNPGGANAQAQPFIAVVACTAGDVISINAVGAGAASSVYVGAIVARQVG